MSRRGGGRGSDSRRDQPSPAAPRGGGGGGRGAGRGRGRGGPAPGPSYAPARSQAAAPPPARRDSPAPSPAIDPPSAARGAPVPPPAARSAATPSPAPSASIVPPPETSAASSSSSAVSAESLAADLERRLTVQEKPLPEAAPSSEKSVRFPARPGYGKFGTKCVVRANHFLVKVADTELCHYDVSVTPEVLSKGVNRKVISQLVQLFRDSHLGGKNPAYDGMKSLYTAGELPFLSKEFRIKLDDSDGQAGTSKRKEREFKVVLKLASKPDIQHLQQFLRGRQHDVPQETIQVLDIVLRQAPAMKYTVVGRSFFHHTLGDKGSLGDGLEYWKGYYQSLRPTQMGLSLNIDVSARAFYEPIPVIEFVEKYLGVRGAKAWTEQERLKVKKALRGVKVESHHLSHKRTYKISGISMEPISKLMFSLDGSQKPISVAQYFWEKYKIHVKYGNWPAIQAGSATKPVSLPIEICSIVGGQRYSRKLNETQVRNLLRATCQRPNVRENSIKGMVAINEYHKGKAVNEFGIQVSTVLTTVDARILPPPTILYHGTGRTAIENPRMGAWNMIDKKMVDGGRVDVWSCVNFSRWDDGLVDQFCGELISMCSSRGMVFAPQPFVRIRSAPPNKIEKTLVDMHAESFGQNKKQLQLLIVILPNATGSYPMIKRVCETELGIVTQCCKPTARINQQYFENLSLKINVKVGGRNSVLNDAIKRNIPLVTDAPTIIFGADVTHPSPGDDSCPSIAAVVASMDWPQVTKYRGLVSAQSHREEMIEDLYKSYVDPAKGVVHGGMIRDLLLAFFRSTNQKPHRIIFYRDGVSEGQFSQVLLHEMDAIRKGCMSLQANYLPPVTFVVVQKRHHTRLFPVDRGFSDKSGNIQPGTVVDTQICHPTEFDFYLNSHAGIQGTSRPAHYHVLLDENRFTADALQILTNNLCYTYARCTRSVSIVPPAYYAHLAAFRARCYIESDASDAGSSSGGASGGPREFRVLPAIKDNVKDVMFYC